MNIEKLLNTVADSQKMGDWGDSMSFMVNSAKGSVAQVLSDDDLMQVAGGVSVQAKIVKKKNKE